jgi:drug/metabolite transporter (DMT)-like permease
MSQRAQSSAQAMSPAERKLTRLDRMIGVLLVAIGSACLGVSLLRFASHLAGNRVQSEAVLTPMVTAIVLASGGSMLLLAASAMRRRSTDRWTVQWAALFTPFVLGAFAWFSLR